MTDSNAEKIFDDLENSYRDIIDQMDSEFTSHDFIEKLSQAHQDLYVQVLNEYAEKGQPFQSVHSVLAKRLRKHSDLFEYIGTDPSSENIFGNYNGAAIWRKK